MFYFTVEVQKKKGWSVNTLNGEDECERCGLWRDDAMFMDGLAELMRLIR